MRLLVNSDRPYEIQGDPEQLVAQLVGEPDYDDAEMVTRWMIRVKYLQQTAMSLAFFGDQRGVRRHVVITTRLPANGLTMWDLGQEPIMEPTARVAWDPAQQRGHGEDEPPLGDEINQLPRVEVSADSDLDFIRSLTDMGIIQVIED